MSTSQKLNASLQSILNGDPWYGPNTYSIIDGISFEAACETPPGSVHNIAGILLHMLGWTHETTERMRGQTAGEPIGGDWPDPGKPDEQKWQRLKDDFKLANVVLSGVISNFPKDRWEAPINDARNSEAGTGVTYLALIEGLTEHHVYHSGQLALLNRIVG
jgi:uncharacterized damage-inducible protein DinB